MVLTRIVLLVMASALLVTSYLAMKYYRDTEREPGKYMRRFLYISIFGSSLLIVAAGFQFLFALAIAVVLTPLIMWYMKGGQPIKKIGALYSKLPETVRQPLMKSVDEVSGNLGSTP
jgi:uncharacterized membrane protein YdbT with pleckstrin-like domain